MKKKGVMSVEYASNACRNVKHKNFEKIFYSLSFSFSSFSFLSKKKKKSIFYFYFSLCKKLPNEYLPFEIQKISLCNVSVGRHRNFKVSFVFPPTDPLPAANAFVHQNNHE